MNHTSGLSGYRYLGRYLGRFLGHYLWILTLPNDAAHKEAARKVAARKEATLLRKAAFHKYGDGAGLRLADYTAQIRALSAAKLVAGYWPIRSEIDSRPLLLALQAQGMALCLPSTPETGLPLRFHHWDGDGDQLIAGPYGTRQPDPDLPVVLPELVLAPLLAFDANCWRLGYGGGFYDRTLASFDTCGHSAKIIGLAYDEQEAECVPTGPYDRCLDAILTPQGLRMKLL